MAMQKNYLHNKCALARKLLSTAKIIRGKEVKEKKNLALANTCLT